MNRPSARLVIVIIALGSPATAQKQDAYLKAFNSDPGDFFGFSVATDGERIVVGAWGESGSGVGVDPPDDNAAGDSGAAYVFVADGSTWTLDSYLKASNTDPDDEFGFSVAIDGDTIVVGAANEDSSALGVNGDDSDNSVSASGAAYVFVRGGTTWSQQAYLKASNAESADFFGEAVAISGDTIVVGAIGEDSNAQGVNGNASNNSKPFSGAAYVFVRSGTQWSQQAYLKASNPTAGDTFGNPVAIDGDTIVVGVENEDGSATVINGPDDDLLFDAGAAYVFVRNGSSWTQQAYLKPLNADTQDKFGSAVDVDADTIVVGARFEASSATGVDGDPIDNSVSTAGAAYAFVRQGTSWTQQAYLKAHVAQNGGRFGEGVAISGDRVLVGAPLLDGALLNAGSVISFVRCRADWYLDGYVEASNPGRFDWFGLNVNASDERFVVGAHQEDSASNTIDGDPHGDTAIQTGAAYAFADPTPPAPTYYCTPKTSSADCVSTITATIPCDAPVSGAGDYALSAPAQGFKTGLLGAGFTGPVSIPFNGGTLCALPPILLGPVQFSGGTGPLACDGLFTAIVNDGSAPPSGFDPGSGNTGWYQFWYRDSQSGPGTLGTALSDAVQLEFL